MKKDRKIPYWLKRDPVTNKLQPENRFAGGSYDALNRAPTSLRKPGSYLNKILAVLAGYRGEKLSAKQVKALYLCKHDEHRPSINARLSDLYVYGLVDHFEDPDNACAGFWAIKPDLDISDCEKLYQTAIANVARLKTGKQQMCVLPQLQNKRLLTE